MQSSGRCQNGNQYAGAKATSAGNFSQTVILLLLVAGLPAVAFARPKLAKQPVPVVDAESGPCSVEMTVTTGAGDPVYAAKIRSEVSHGFLGLSTTDLEIGTNTDGKAKFIGLPENTDGVIYFRASKGGQEGLATDDPAENCQARHFIVLHRQLNPPDEDSNSDSD